MQHSQAALSQNGCCCWGSPTCVQAEAGGVLASISLGGALVQSAPGAVELMISTSASRGQAALTAFCL